MGLGVSAEVTLGAAWLAPHDLTWAGVALLLLAALAAGFVDAVVGGGGLIQLPALLLVPGMSPVQALATNKLGGVFGTATSSVTFYRRVRPDPGTFTPMAVLAGLGSVAGAACASLLPAAVFRPIILLALVAVAAYTLATPTLGERTALRYAGHRHVVVAALAGAAIGFYDGILGPGTGSFLVFALVGLLGYAFLEASATAKIVNFATNLGALGFFAVHGSVLWGLGIAMGLANMTGSYLGARTAIGAGNRFVRVFFLVVVGALIARLGWQLAA
ncbi:MAG: TSUP family transporter, partial [Actinomycetales bacterium]